VLYFECFSKDESSYGCLTVERDGGFGRDSAARLGTTNVDYSWELYNHFQGLRTYRQTRFSIDPQGFELSVGDQQGYREEKIDLPASWLRGFMQLQGAMGCRCAASRLTREALYALLAYLKGHRARSSPRAIRFELKDGRPPELVLEPWSDVGQLGHALQRAGWGADPGSGVGGACSAWRDCCRCATGSTSTCWEPAFPASGSSAWVRCV
jgi:hypothetical protein